MSKRPGKREEIVVAAIRLLASGGPEGLSASALAAEAGVSKANLFHHFDSLDDIVIAAFERFLNGMPALRPAAGMPLRDWLLALGVETAAMIEGRPAEAGAYLAFMGRAQADERLRLQLRQVVESFEQALIEALELLAPGRWGAAEARAIASLLLLAGDGLAIHRQLFPQRGAAQNAAWAVLVDLIAKEKPI